MVLPMMKFVNRFSACVVLYLIAVAGFINCNDSMSSDPHKWWY